LAVPNNGKDKIFQVVTTQEKAMSMDFKGSKTEKNLLAAFAGESQARNRYTYFASEAKKAGYEQIAAIFLDTAENEKEHAKIFFKLLKGGEVEITAAYPAGVIGETAANLKAGAAGENLEWTALYQNFEKRPNRRGFRMLTMPLPRWPRSRSTMRPGTWRS
jgi:rubrerythrin